MIRSCLPLTLAALLLVLGCGSSSSSQGTQTLPPSQGMVTLAFTGNSSPDWAGLDFKLLGVTLTPAEGTAPVPLLTAPTGGIPFNLVQLDHLGQFMGNFGVPAGQYTAATVTLSGAYSDMEMDSASVPSQAFPWTAESSVQMATVGLQNPQVNQILTLAVPFAAPLVATTTQTTVLDLDWDSMRPTFLLASPVPLEQSVMWALDFDQVLSQRILTDPAQLPLLPVYGAVYEVAPDLSSFQLSPAYAAGLLSPVAVLPQTLVVTPDAVNGTLFIDENAGTSQIITDLSTVGDALPGRRIRAGGQLQADGSLKATRLWAGAGFELGTETSGRITAVAPATGMVTLDGADSSQDGFVTGLYGQVSATSALTILNPLDEAAPVTALAGGAGLVAGGGLARGFLVHPVVQFSQVAPFTNPFPSMDIESANFHGSLTSADGQQLTCSTWTGGTDDVPVTLPYLAAATPNGNDATGNPITGFSWWFRGSPAQITSGPGAAASFAAAATASVAFGGTVGALQPVATIHAAWGDAANPSGWSAQYAVLEPVPLPQGTPATAWTPAASGGSFGLALPGGASPVTVDVAGGSTPAQVYEVTVNDPTQASNLLYSPTSTLLDLTTPAGQTTLTNLLASGNPVQVFGLPEANGHLQAWIVFCYTYEEY